jgi:hypothetical protein
VPLALPRDLEDHLVLALEASNPGRLAVTVCNFGLLLADSTWIEPQVLERFEPTGRAARLGLTLVTALPFTVPPGERATIPLKLDALGHRLELAGWSGEVRLRPYCADATDRVHRGRPVTFVTNPGVFVGLASIGVPRCPARAQAPVYPPGGHFPT